MLKNVHYQPGLDQLSSHEHELAFVWCQNGDGRLGDLATDLNFKKTLV